MELRSILADNSQVEFVINEIRKQSKTLATDVICAYNLFCDNNPDLNESAMQRLENVFVMCKYMEPEAEDVISMMLYHDSLINKATMHTFMQYFSEKRYERYHNQMSEACKNAPKNDELTRDECISYYIMMRVCDKMFNRLMKAMNKNRVPNTITISKAYSMAKEAHQWVTRKSGEPYIVHPIRVAGILAQVGVESPVIAAALLHDVVEDTDYTLEDIANECGVKVSQYVDAVTSVHREYAESHRPSEYQCDKAELDERSFQKLVRTVASNREMIFALYIKAADRIHNLSTIDSMSSIKIHNKNDETQLDYLPLFRAFKLNYFVQVIEDLMWRATDIERYTKMKEKYDDMLSRNRVFLDEFKTILRTHTETEVNGYAQLLGSAGYDVEIHERQLLPYEVYNEIKDAGGSIGNLSKRIDKRYVPVCDIDIVADPRDATATLDTFVAGFVKMFESNIAMTGRTIIDFYDGKKGKGKSDKKKSGEAKDDNENKSMNVFVFEVEDHYRNVFRCRIIMRDEYDTQKRGVCATDVVEDLEEDPGTRVEKINVQLRNGKIIPMPKGSTVIDVAFAIHEEIGYTVKSATINGHRVTIYNTLLDGDKIIIEADTCRVDGVTQMDVHVPHVRISWLNWVVTKRAKKKIIEFLSDKYEGDDPKNETEAQTTVVETVADKILGELRSTT